MQTKHTQGEWTPQIGTLTTSIRDERNIAICEIKNLSLPNEFEANAKLIAAAPDLLEALKSLQAILCDCEGNPCFEGSEGDEIVAQKAFETIKKATS